ncbi:MAG TPA: pantetheine-phosphate adenylyltransferase [Anaerolineales bacterium]|nr:pantetheine-phosphate adenylyltransferase [Anaerolineales bacterium]
MKILAVYPGTFDPIHYGHMDIARRAASLFDALLIAVYDKPLKSLLFPPEERMAMVEETVKYMGLSNVRVTGYSGLTVEFCRTVGAKVVVRGLRVFSDFELEFRMALANHRLAPDIETMSLITNEEHTFLSGTTVREIASLGGDVSSMVPPHVAAHLKRRFLELGDDGGKVVPMTSLRD